jgi:hypothetical protein
LPVHWFCYQQISTKKGCKLGWGVIVIKFSPSKYCKFNETAFWVLKNEFNLHQYFEQNYNLVLDLAILISTIVKAIK